MKYNEKSFKLFCGILSQSKYGSISLLYLGKQIFYFKSKEVGPVVNVTIKDLKCIENFFFKGRSWMGRKLHRSTLGNKGFTSFFGMGC